MSKKFLNELTNEQTSKLLDELKRDLNDDFGLFTYFLADFKFKLNSDSSFVKIDRNKFEWSLFYDTYIGDSGYWAGFRVYTENNLIKYGLLIWNEETDDEFFEKTYTSFSKLYKALEEASK